MSGIGSTEPLENSDLVERAEAVAQKAYAPYSNYFVGAVGGPTAGPE
jgi:cytidine deaminase